MLPPNEPMSTTRRRVWLRIQQTPLQIAVAFLAAVQAVLLLADQGAVPQSGWEIFTACLLIVGGLTTTVARLRDALVAESIGDALLIGAFGFVTFEDLAYAADVLQAVSVIATIGSLVLGFAVRLWTVRKAVRAIQRHRSES